MSSTSAATLGHDAASPARGARSEARSDADGGGGGRAFVQQLGVAEAAAHVVAHRQALRVAQRARQFSRTRLQRDSEAPRERRVVTTAKALLALLSLATGD